MDGEVLRRINDTRGIIRVMQNRRNKMVRYILRQGELIECNRR